MLPGDEIAQASLVSTTAVEVSDQPTLLALVPRIPALTSGLIFYPGARVDPAAYVPLLKPLAESGTLVVIPKMPLGFAVLDVQRAAEVQAAYPQITCWAMGGHSLGGSMAAAFTAEASNQVDGIVFVASYPAKSTSLAALPIQGLVISGTQDGLVAPEDIAAVKANFPEQTKFIVLEGANHAQFGSYGVQRGDLPASLSPEDQLEQSSQAMLEFFSTLKTVCSQE